jgi:hypothetical protein
VAVLVAAVLDADTPVMSMTRYSPLSCLPVVGLTFSCSVYGAALFDTPSMPKSLSLLNRVLSFLSLPLIDAGRLPPVRYRRQGDGLTERYADLVRAAIDEAQPPVS